MTTDNQTTPVAPEHRKALRAGIGIFIFVLISLLQVPLSHATSSQAVAKKQFVKQDLGVLKLKIKEFLMAQSAGYSGNVTTTAGGIDPNLKLAACFNPEVFLPSGSRAWGKTSVGVRCDAPSVWKIYVQARVSIKAQYLVAALPLAQGHVMTSQDLAFAEGDLTQLPAGVFTDAAQAIGRTVSRPMMAGSVLRQGALKQALAIQQGQAVLLTTIGKGFSITAEGKALRNANIGQVVSVRVRNGQVVSGIARAGGKVEVSF